MENLLILLAVPLVLGVTMFMILHLVKKAHPSLPPPPSRTGSSVSPKQKPQFTTELEALIAIEANTRQALELLRQQNRKSFWSMLFLFGMFSDD